MIFFDGATEQSTWIVRASATEIEPRFRVSLDDPPSVDFTLPSQPLLAPSFTIDRQLTGELVVPDAVTYTKYDWVTAFGVSAVIGMMKVCADEQVFCTSAQAELKHPADENGQA